MFYLDTSFVVASLTSDEVQSENARRWLETAEPETLVVSDWVKTEISSALSLKIRIGQLTIEDRTVVLQRWYLLLAESLSTIKVQPEDFESAGHFVDRHELSLRAGDALHIAIAQRAGCTLVTLDKRMADAAVELGVPVAEITA
jgi:uncharacterized protein